MPNLHIANVDKTLTPWILAFGAYGDTRVLTYARSLEDALEECAGWLADHAPGLIVSDAELNDLRREACAEAGLAWPPPEDAWDREDYIAAFESAETDLTYTESGWIPSYEWGIVAENPSPAEIAAIYHDRRTRAA